MSILTKLRSLRGRFYHFSIPILDNYSCIDYIKEHNSSVIRLGDGELDIIRGKDIPYQKYDKKLSQELRELLFRGASSEVLICLPDVFKKLDRYDKVMKGWYYQNYFYQNRQLFREIEKTKNWYGSTFLSRAYIGLVDKSNSASYFTKLRSLWDDRDILIVEGKYTRSGEGNDLFDNAKSVERIICPSKDAYSKVDVVCDSIKKHGKGKLVLVMLGPAAKVIVDRLSGYMQLIDIGHLDSEFEWFKMKATTKVTIPHKHTAEHNFDDDSIKLLKDEKFDKQIVDTIE